MRINRQRVRPAHDAKINVFLLPFLVISRAFAKRGENATGDSFSKSHAMCPYIPFTCSLIEPVRDCKLYLAVNDTAWYFNAMISIIIWEWETAISTGYHMWTGQDVMNLESSETLRFLFHFPFFLIFAYHLVFSWERTLSVFSWVLLVCVFVCVYPCCGWSVCDVVIYLVISYPDLSFLDLTLA